MHIKLATWKLIAESLKKNLPVIILYVLDSKGSSPGRRGFFMAVNSTGEMSGSIGGGIMEHKFVEMAKARLNEDESYTSIHKQIHDKSATKHRSGMICSGEQVVFIYKISGKDFETIHHFIHTIVSNEGGYIIINPTGIAFTKEYNEEGFIFEGDEPSTAENWSYIEKLGYRNELYIIGGGHCALALSQIMSMMDFYIRVYDDRPTLNTLEHNSGAHGKHVVGSYDALGELIPLSTPGGVDAYVVIMTFGFRTDEIALRALMHKDFKYIGCLGSKKKMAELFDEFRMEGVAEERLSGIHSPIGIQIHSQTPAEIAVSIAAEIIGIKNGNR